MTDITADSLLQEGRWSEEEFDESKDSPPDIHHHQDEDDPDDLPPVEEVRS